MSGANISIVTCPVCGAVFDKIKHAGEPSDMAIAMLAGDGRRLHSAESPKCKGDSRWFQGWLVETRPISDFQ